MTARAETVAPISTETRQHLATHRDELQEIIGVILTEQDELRADALLGLPVPLDTLRLIRDAADLLLIASRRIDPNDQETTR